MSYAQLVNGEQASLADDPELVQAMEIFAGMSPQEMEETVRQLMEVVGNDPETIAELKSILEMIPQIESASNLEQMTQDDELAAATEDALRLLGGTNWDAIWEKQEDILKAVLASGQLTPEDAATFKTDQSAWEKELKFIWGELQKQASLKQEL